MKINWLDYFETLFEDVHHDARKIFLNEEKIIIKNMKQFEAVIKILSNVSKKVFISALWWQVVQSVSGYATKELRNFYYDYATSLHNIELQSREVRCLSLVKNYFSFLFTYMLIRSSERNAADVKEEISEMVRNIQISYSETITKSTWLDEGTKMATLNKLRYITQQISYGKWMSDPDEIDALYEKFQVLPGLHYATTRAGKLAERKRNLSFFGTENNSNDAVPLINPVVVNAFYLPSYNSMEIPIGILGPPFYDLGLQALNYGAIGTILGHEMGHAFDDYGMEYDSWGRKYQWWMTESNIEYNKKIKCFEDFYGMIYIPKANKSINGKLTLGENVADYLGFMHALKAYRKYVELHGKEKFLPHFEHYSHEKLFTMAFANAYCDNTTPYYIKWQIEKDEHSPSQGRILGVLKNSPEFSDIWRCSEHWEMNPKNKCNLW